MIAKYPGHFVRRPSGRIAPVPNAGLGGPPTVGVWVAVVHCHQDGRGLLSRKRDWLACIGFLSVHLLRGFA